MAKLALINREDKRRKTVKKFAAKRAELKAIIKDVARDDEERAKPRCKSAGAAAQCQRMPSAQPLSADRTTAWRIPQVRPVPQQDPRNRHEGRGAWRHQGKLVREQRYEHE
jgi:hypothetical protein